MTLQNDNLKQQTRAGKQTKSDDPRHIITPDAFVVADDLLGLPLASPKRRAAAMGLDLLLIQQLSHIGSMLLGLSIGLVLLLLSQSKGRKSVGSSRKSIFKSLAILLILFVIANEAWQYSQSNEFSLFKIEHGSKTVAENSINEQQDIVADLPIDEQLSIAKDQLETLEDENRALRADDDSDIIDLFSAMATKFGYGFGWAGVYFTLFVYLLRGQTPGKFVFRIKIIQLDGQRLTIWNSFGRYGGYAASVVTGLTGFLQIFWDANRQGLHDKVSSTVVIRL